MDPAILKLVLSNVISNAVKHSDVGGEIQLRLEEGTRLAVENTSQVRPFFFETELYLSTGIRMLDGITDDI